MNSVPSLLRSHTRWSRELRLTWYVGVVVILSVVAGTACIAWGASSGSVGLVVGLIAFGASTERFKVKLFGETNISLSVLATGAAAVTGGAADAIIVAATVGAIVHLGSDSPLRKVAFNSAAYALSTVSFVLVYDLVGRTVQTGTWTAELLPATVAVMADLSANALLVGIVLCLATGESLRQIVTRNYAFLTLQYLPFGAVIAVAGSGYPVLGVWIVPLLAVCAAGTQIMTSQYIAMRRAYEAGEQEIAELVERLDAQLRLTGCDPVLGLRVS